MVGDKHVNSTIIASTWLDNGEEKTETKHQMCTGTTAIAKNVYDVRQGGKD